MRIYTEFTSYRRYSIAKGQSLVLLRMFKALGLHEENADKKEEKRRREGGRGRGKKTRIVLNAVLILGSFENHESHGLIFHKNTHMHKLSLFLRISFIRIYES